MQPQYQYRYFGAFRLLLALMVAVSHFQVTYAPLSAKIYLSPLNLGEIAVFLFFVLSGYIITEALFVFYNGRPGAFIANRFFRLFPPFFAAFAISIAVHLAVRRFHLPLLGLGYDYGYASLNLKTIFRNIFSLLDWHIPQGRENYYLFVRYVWAVVIEWQFYVIAMFLFALAYKWRPYVRLVVVIPFFFFSYLWASRFGDFPSSTMPFYGQYFLLGVVFYGLTIRSIFGRIRKALPWFAGAVALLTVHDYVVIWNHTLITGLILMIGLATVYFLSLSNDLWFSSDTVKIVDSKLGNLSYPLYLNHYAVEVGMFSITAERSWSLLIGAICISLILSVAAYFLTEPLTAKIRNSIRGQLLAH